MGDITGKGKWQAVVQLRLAEETRSDVAHVGLFELVVLATHLIDADIVERRDDLLYIEAHSDKAVNEVLVVTLVCCEFDLFLVLFGLLGLALDGFCCSTPTCTIVN